MNEEVGIFWLQEALTAVVVLAGPVMTGALVVGLIIAVLQAATTVQEMTLSYIPKMIAVVVILFLLFGFMLQYAVNFTERIYDFIPSIAQ